jgi:hypothetical protein
MESKVMSEPAAPGFFPMVILIVAVVPFISGIPAPGGRYAKKIDI